MKLERQWYKINDSVIEKISFDELIESEETTCMLVYEQVFRYWYFNILKIDWFGLIRYGFLSVNNHGTFDKSDVSSYDEDWDFDLEGNSKDCKIFKSYNPNLKEKIHCFKNI